MRIRARILSGAVMASVLAAGAVQAGGDYMLLAHPEAVDGKSFTDDSGNRYRLHAVDAPEIEQQCIGSDGEEYACGEESREALASMITGILTCNPVDMETSEWRIVRCYDFSGRDIGARLVAKGWAIPDRSAGRLDYVMDELEAEARRLGIWQGRFVAPQHWRAGARL